MDPISGVASIIAIIGAANTTTRVITRIRSLKGVPKAIEELVDEAEAFGRLLGNIERLVEPVEAQGLLLPQENMTHESEPLLSVYLKQAKSKLNELDEIIDKKFRENSGKSRHNRSTKRLAWLSNEERVKALRNDIHSIRNSITTCLAMSAVTTQFRLQNQLERATTPTTETSPPTLKTDPVGHVDLPVVPQPTEASFRTENCCKISCACCCHKRARVQVSGFARHLLGSLYLAYSQGYSHLPCNEQSCRGRLQTMFNFTYHFPRWLVNGMIDAYWRADFIGCPTVALRMPRIQPDTAPIFHLAAAGDVIGMRHMFQSGLASPDDVSYAFGFSVLHFAVDMEHIDAIIFLIEEGANPLLANRLNLTAIDLTWNRILSNRIIGTKEIQLASCFGSANGEHQVQSRKLTRLQQIILGLVEADLDNAIDNSSQTEINATDADANTVLSWAARSGNTAALRALLKRGADLDPPSRFGSTALHYAASARSPDGIRPLLEAGADANIRNTCLQETPLHVAALRHDEPELFLQPLLEYGANLDACDHEGSSTVAFAVQANHARSLKFLLDHGADADAPDESGIPPIGVAIIYKHAAPLQILLDHGASIHFVTETGQTLLHLVALYGDLSIISVLRGAAAAAAATTGTQCRWLLLSPDSLDKTGSDASKYAKARGRNDEAFYAAFTDLITAMVVVVVGSGVVA